ncbi:MAG TPA: S-methyl-5'-thioadenosine phosphorylase, partial [Ktedonobacteraceae bacterium]|nr:S-methyl-5'-thioadenosine phosphorylase [Ktedonobacteraceae bacterium]
VEMVLSNLNANVTNAQRILTSIARKIPTDRSANTCGCSHALETSIITDSSMIPSDVKEKYALLISKYLV